MATETTYSARITNQPITTGEMASHRQYIAAAQPMIRGLAQIRDTHADKFTAAELATLAAARKLLECNEVACALITVTEDAPAKQLARDFQTRIRANLREMLDFDERGFVDIAAAAWPDLGRHVASRKLNRLTAVEGQGRSVWTPIEYHHAAALAEALGVDPGDFYEAG